MPAQSLAARAATDQHDHAALLVEGGAGPANAESDAVYRRLFNDQDTAFNKTTPYSIWRVNI
jgi:hypothetical protein